ncbi:MAG TPA: hypothetical protein VLG69_04480 [Candidatus Andersenbacteria bacterium]|nr:hypothetical protein [Candidatus Andersenbacteria bacterium]
MKSLNVDDALKQLSGMFAKITGPFLVVDLNDDEEFFGALEVGEHGMEEVPELQRTQPHSHEFVSAYKSEGLNILAGEELHALPQRCLVIVLPGTSHSWLPKVLAGAVGSCDSKHEKQELVMQ